MQITTFLERLRKISSAALTLLVLVVASAPAAHADPGDLADGIDPPGRIGRIAWLSGTVNLSAGQAGESFQAVRNQPLTSGDVLRTEPGARAEVQIGSLTLRLDAESELELTQLDDERIRMFLVSGRVIAKLPGRDSVADFELTTRDGRFFPRETGLYRFDADVRSTVGTVYAGQLQGESGRSAVAVDAGQGAQFWLDDGDQAHYRLLAAVDDDFTQWSAGLDQRLPASSSPTTRAYARYVSPEMTGAADLDAWGDWSENAEYGAIWSPRSVSADWAPYRDGHWVWVDPWGWNWVGHEPWGFAPFHYGRWINYRGAWAWVPGVRVVRPVYSPAMVAWVGTAGASVSFSVGARYRPNAGWFPLAPHEVYVPVFRSSPRYVRNVNQPHVTRIDNVTIIASRPQQAMRDRHYANRDLPHAVTRLPDAAWRSPTRTERRLERPSTSRLEERRQLPATVREPFVRPGVPPVRMAPSIVPAASARGDDRRHVRPENSPGPAGFETRAPRWRENREESSPARRTEQREVRSMVPPQAVQRPQAAPDTSRIEARPAAVMPERQPRHFSVMPEGSRATSPRADRGSPRADRGPDAVAGRRGDPGRVANDSRHRRRDLRDER